MEEGMSAEFKKQIRKNLPRRAISFDREIATKPVALYSSPSASHVNIVSSAAQDYRPSPERKTTFRLSRELTTAQEPTGAEAQEDAHERRVWNSSQTGGQGKAKTAKHTDTRDSAREDERVRGKWFKSILKRIPGFD